MHVSFCMFRNRFTDLLKKKKSFVVFASAVNQSFALNIYRFNSHLPVGRWCEEQQHDVKGADGSLK